MPLDQPIIPRKSPVPLSPHDERVLVLAEELPRVGNGSQHLSRAPGRTELQGLLDKLIARLMKMPTRKGYREEEEGMSYLADIDSDGPLASLQAASCTYRIAFGARAGQKVLSLRTVADQDEKPRKVLCADAHGFSLHAAVRCGADQRKQLERLCRYITRPALANERLSRNAKGQVVLQLKSPYRDGTTHILLSAYEFMQSLAVELLRARRHGYAGMLNDRLWPILLKNSRLMPPFCPPCACPPSDATRWKLAWGIVT